MPDKYGIPSAGDKVIFLGRNGYNHELEYAKTVLTEGQVLTVIRSDVQNWSSTLQFEGITGRQKFFNSVMFELLGAEKSDPSFGLPNASLVKSDADRLDELLTQFEWLARALVDISKSADGTKHWAYEGTEQRLDAKRQEIKDMFALVAGKAVLA